MAQIITSPVIHEVNLELPSDGPIRRTAINESKIEYVELNTNPSRDALMHVHTVIQENWI